MKTFFIHTLMVLFLISGTHFVFAHCDNLKAEASFSINEDDEAYIYARASVSNLTYWPFMVFGRAYIIPFLLIILSLPVVRNQTENGRHKLEVYATIKSTNWKFMLQ